MTNLVDSALDRTGPPTAEVRAIMDERYETAVRPQIIMGNTIIPVSVVWQWAGRIPAGRPVVISGNPGFGKSLATLSIVATITTGSPWPDGAPAPRPGGAVILSAEDDPSDTIVPRLTAMGADLNRVAFVSTVETTNGPDQIMLPTHVDALYEAIIKVEARVCVLDPVTAYLPGEYNSWRDQDVRRALRPLADLARETTCALVIVRHLSKHGTGPAVLRGGGSIGFSAAARAEHLLAPDPEVPDRRIFAPIKMNLSKHVPSLLFRIVADDHGRAMIEWEGASDYRADDLVQDDHDGHNALADAVDFLRVELSEGARPSHEVLAAARKAGIADRTLTRARQRLGVRTGRIGFGPGSTPTMSLPSTPPDYTADERAGMAEA